MPKRCAYCRPVRALSLLQPYAGLVVVDPLIAPRKRIENRSRLIFQPEKGGQWLALHASRGRYDGGAGFDDRMDAVFPGWRHVPDVRGALLGVFHVREVRRYESGILGTAHDLAERDLGPQAFGPVCYIIDDARPLPVPIPCAGTRGLWTAPEAHWPALRALAPPGAWS